MNELDIVDRLSIHRTMSQYLTIDQLIFALNCDRAQAKAEIERLRTQAKRHEAEIAELVAALKGARHKYHCLLLDPFEPESHCNCGLDAVIAKYEVKK